MEVQNTGKIAMTSIVLHLPLDTERKLREKAMQTGQTLEAYLEQLAQHDAENTNDTGTGLAFPPPLSDEEFDRLLDQLSEGAPLPHLPADFSRSDIYADHD
jgi:hypothetical protein